MDIQVSAGAKTPRLTDAVGSIGPLDCASRTPIWLALGDLNEAAVVLQDQVLFGVVGTEFDAPGAGQRTALAADLGAGHIGQYRLPVGGGEELDDVGGRECVDDALPQSGWHAGADEQPHRMVAVQRKLRVVDDVAQHRPGVGHHRDAVLANLLDEPVRHAVRATARCGCRRRPRRPG